MQSKGKIDDSVYKRSLMYHEHSHGKISIINKTRLKTNDDLSLAYSPGVSEPCRRIAKNSDDAYRYTSKGNMVAVVSDGTSVLGLGDIGPLAAIPVMEGKAMLFKFFAGVDAFPFCLDTKNTEDIINTVKNLAPSFGAINLEDISAPRCFEIETRLNEMLDIPVFHDDQHGAALVTIAGLTNALKVVGKHFNEIKVAISGAGAAATASVNMLIDEGTRNIIVCDSKGIIHKGRQGLNPAKERLAEITNKEQVTGTLSDAMKDADVFIGFSVGRIVSQEMVHSMASDAIVFPLANPIPEIMPDKAIHAGARIVGTGRSDLPNQVNNVLGFPGVFRGALDVRATEINREMKLSAAYTIASLIEPTEDMILPDIFDTKVAPAVASSVAEAAIKTKVARLSIEPEEVAENTRKLLRLQ